MRAKFSEHLVTIPLRSHVNEVNDDYPSNVPKSELLCNLPSRFKVGSENGLLRILLTLAGKFPSVHVYGDKGLSRLYYNVSPRLESNGPLKCLLNLLSNLVLVEEWQCLSVQVHPVE